MTFEKPSYIPEFIGLLDAETATEQLTEGLLTGVEKPRSLALDELVQPLPHEERFRARPVRALLDRVMHLCRNEKPTAADEWLAPRLHATLRLTRAEAADPELWSCLALLVAPDYVVWRHGRSGKVDAVRFQGPHYKQAFARLWWAAEMFRDGDDYRPAARICRNQDMLNTALRLDVVDHRPVAQAVAVLLERGVVTTGREVNALCTVVNAAAMTLAYDVIAPDIERDQVAVADWIRYEAVLPGDLVLPTGPAESRAPQESVDTLTELFADLFKDAPVRDREQVDEPEEVTSR
ncbi:DUF6339 family protein [Streptomyces beihaiensis]|uniref:DUF6339 family protein n=1 Tax=Streptomyces beihaiensis TaxID=2984495 RepID=A0ABT3U4R1_9ACTN|nr:DUF6339 family protein [Streptomyces beihaiensis]MCX3063631.1 DUF6339 family protein [Streptomyces beihaiensis]